MDIEGVKVNTATSISKAIEEVLLEQRKQPRYFSIDKKSGSIGFIQKGDADIFSVTFSENGSPNVNLVREKYH